MKVSQVTVEELADYLRIDDPGDVELREIEEMKTSAIAYIKSSTGLDEEELDKCEDIVQALFLIVADYFDNRNMYVDGKMVNKAVDSILGMHSVNLL